MTDPATETDSSEWIVVDRVPMDPKKFFDGAGSDIELDQLDEGGLVAFINAEHAQVEVRKRAAAGELSHGVRHGIRAGLALLEVKQRHQGNSNWQAWIHEHLDLRYEQVSNYIRWAYYRHEIEGTAGAVTTHNVGDLLRGLPMVPRPDRYTIPVDMREQIKADVASGESKKSVAARYDVDKESVYRIVDPDFERRRFEQQRARRARRAAERKALERQELTAAAKRAGGRLDKSYSLVRQLASEIDAVMADYPDVRSDLRAALSFVHKAEDSINAAIRGRS